WQQPKPTVATLAGSSPNRLWRRWLAAAQTDTCRHCATLAGSSLNRHLPTLATLAGSGPNRLWRRWLAAAQTDTCRHWRRWLAVAQTDCGDTGWQQPKPTPGDSRQ